MQHCRETAFFHHGCYMFAHQSSTPKLEIVNPPKGNLVTTVTHLQSNSVKVDQQTQSADKLCRKSHPTSMFGNSSAVQNRKFPLYPHVFPMIFPYFPYEIGHFGHLSARKHSESPSVNSIDGGHGCGWAVG